MAVAYTLVPRDMLQAMRPVPRNIDEFIVEKAANRMQNIKRARNMRPEGKIKKYQAQLRNIMKTNKDVRSRPVRVQIVNERVPRSIGNSYGDPSTRNETAASARILKTAEEDVLNQSRAYSDTGARRSRNLSRNADLQNRTIDLDETQPSTSTARSRRSASVPPKKINPESDRTLPIREHLESVESYKSALGSAAGTPSFMDVDDEEELFDQSDTTYMQGVSGVPSPSSASKSKASPRGTRKTAGFSLKDEPQLERFISKSLEYLSKHGDQYGIKDGKIVGEDKKLILNSNLKRAVEFILTSKYRYHRNAMPTPGAKRLQAKVNNDRAFVRFLKRMEKDEGPYMKRVGKSPKSGLTGVQKGLGQPKEKRIATRSKKNGSADLAKKIGNKANTRIIAAMKRSNAALQLGRGKRGRPREKPVARESNGPFRAENWLRPKR